jgi:hypothetical protein
MDAGETWSNSGVGAGAMDGAELARVAGMLGVELILGFLAALDVGEQIGQLGIDN